jgi:nucleotide sugar dehydrogenase
MRVCVVGLGKIGLPLAVQIASKGIEVIGADISSQTVDQVNKGLSPFPGEAGLEEMLRDAVDRGVLSAVTDTQRAVTESSVVVVVVPLVTDEDGTPDFASIDSATMDIGSGLQTGALVSYETTLPVGTTRTRFGPMIQESSGLEAGSGFYLVHSPERVYSGRIFSDLRRYPKLVGGINEESRERGVAFYETILEFDDRPDLQRPNGVWPLASAEAAEMAKLAETTYRDVNIALANQFAEFAESTGVDVAEVIDAANSQPFSHIHRPGVAVGGHCIPVYPRFYLSGHPNAELVDAARRVNLSVPERVVETLERDLDGLGEQTVLILGAAYRGGVKETAFSGAFDLAREISKRGGLPVVADPLYDDVEIAELGFVPWDGSKVDAAIVQADHAEYRDLDPAAVPGARVVYDGRNILNPTTWVGSGVTLRIIGQGANSR